MPSAYYYVFISMIKVFCLKQGRYEPTKVYYILFESAISKAELEKCTVKKHVDFNKTYAGGDNYNFIKRLQMVCLLMSAYSKKHSGICNDLTNSTSLGMEN